MVGDTVTCTVQLKFAGVCPFAGAHDGDVDDHSYADAAAADDNNDDDWSATIYHHHLHLNQGLSDVLMSSQLQQYRKKREKSIGKKP